MLRCGRDIGTIVLLLRHPYGMRRHARQMRRLPICVLAQTAMRTQWMDGDLVYVITAPLIPIRASCR